MREEKDKEEIKDVEKENNDLKRQLQQKEDIIDSIKNFCKFQIEKENDKFFIDSFGEGRICAFNELLEITKFDINYNSQQFKWAEEIMKEENIEITGVDWNLFKRKEDIKVFVETTKKIDEKINKGE